MKIFLFLLLLIFSSGLFAQTPTGYQYRTVREKLIAFKVDSGLHIPAYNGTPSGVRSGVWVGDGAIAIDTTNNIFYIYSGGAWIAQTGNNIYNSNGILSGSRTLTGLNNTRSLTFDSLDFFNVNRNGVTRMYMSSTISGLGSPSGLNSVIVGNTDVWLNYNGGTNYLRVRDTSLFHERASYEGNIHGTFKPFSLIDKSYADSIVSASSVNIYNTNGTLTGNRVMTMSDKSLTFTNSGENKFKVDPVSDTYSLGDGDGTAANINITSSNYSTNFSGVNFSKFTYSGRQWLIGDVDDNWDGIKIQMDNSGVTKYGSLTFGDTTHILIDDVNHYFKFLSREQERVRLNTSGILIPNGIMPTSGSGGTDSAIFRNSSTGQFYLAPGGSGSGTNNANVGSGFRLLKPSTQEIKTLHGESGILLDSSSHTDEITAKADTAVANAGSLTNNVRLYNVRDSLVSAGWGPSTAPTTEPRYQYYMGDVSNVWTWTTAGTGSQILGFPGGGTVPDGWLMGRSCETGTTSTGTAYHYLRSAATYAPIAINSSYRYNIGQKMRFEDLSDVSETYVYSFGFMDDINISATVDGVFFRYNYADSSGKWIICSRSNSSSTEKQTSTTVAADTDYELEINVYAGTAYFYINDVLAGTITTNLPSGSSRATSGAATILKSNGTTNRKLYIEWMATGRQNN